MQIIYISTRGEKYPRFRLWSKKERKLFASAQTHKRQCLDPAITEVSTLSQLEW